MRLWIAGSLLLTLGLIGCGNNGNNNNGSNSNIATTPNTYCLQNSSGCTGYGQVSPQYIQPYPYGPNGYAGYGNGSYNGCQQYPGQWAPIYGANNGLGCMNMGSIQPGYGPSYWQHPSAYSYGGYNGFASYCVVASSYSYWSYGGFGGGTSCTYGTCRPFQVGGAQGYCSSY